MLNGNTLYLETDWFDFRIPSKDSKNVIRFSDITFPLGLIRKITPSNSVISLLELLSIWTTMRI